MFHILFQEQVTCLFGPLTTLIDVNGLCYGSHSLTPFPGLCFMLLHSAVCTSNLLLLTREAADISEGRTGRLVSSTQDCEGQGFELLASAQPQGPQTLDLSNVIFSRVQGSMFIQLSLD